MNKKMRSQLEVAIAVSQALLSGDIFKVSGNEIDAVPVKTATKSAMLNKGFELKRGAKHVGLWWFYHPKAGWVEAKLYLSTAFKKSDKAAKAEVEAVRKRNEALRVDLNKTLWFGNIHQELAEWVSQYGCTCDHPACSRCADTKRANKLLEDSKEAA